MAVLREEKYAEWYQRVYTQAVKTYFGKSMIKEDVEISHAIVRVLSKQKVVILISRCDLSSIESVLLIAKIWHN